MPFFFSRASHAPLLAAYNHLSQPLYLPTVNPNITEESAEQHNEAISAAFNDFTNKFEQEQGTLQTLLSSGRKQNSIPSNLGSNTLHRGTTTGQAATHQTANHSGKKKTRLKHKTKIPSPTQASSISTAGTTDAVPCSIWGTPEEIKLKKARSLSGQGLEAVRCSWGKAQEGATLHVLTAAFPASRVGEVGLCMLEQSVLPKEWGFLKGELPPIGASPDGVITHPPGGPLSERSLLIEPVDVPEEEEEEEETSSSEDACKDSSGSGLSKGEDLLEKTFWTFCARLQEKVSSNLLNSVNNEAATVVKEFTELSLGSDFIGLPISEVIEVKNSCPFDYNQHKRGGKRRFILCDRGPRRQLDTLWIPQLQLHMLCTGTSSVLVASRSATRGVRLFRMRADPELQRLMLCVLRKLWTEHVVPRRIPPRDAFLNMPEHQAMLKRIREVGLAARVVGEVSGEAAAMALAGTDQRFFLD